MCPGYSSGPHRAETFVVKLAQLLAYISFVVPVMSSHWAGAVPPGVQESHSVIYALIVKEETTEILLKDILWTIPMTLQRRRRLVVSPSPASLAFSLQEGGSGMRNPIGRWNLRRRGSMVTTGLKVAWFPSCRVSSSSGIGWAWCGYGGREKELVRQYKRTWSYTARCRINYIKKEQQRK